MRLIKIEKFENGAHDNQTVNGDINIPRGWAVIPEEMETPNFPFGDLTAEDIDGDMTVTSWTPGVIPEVPPIEKAPTVEEILNAMLGVSE